MLSRSGQSVSQPTRPVRVHVTGRIRTTACPSNRANRTDLPYVGNAVCARKSSEDSLPVTFAALLLVFVLCVPLCGASVWIATDEATNKRHTDMHVEPREHFCFQRCQASCHERLPMVACRWRCRHRCKSLTRPQPNGHVHNALAVSPHKPTSPTTTAGWMDGAEASASSSAPSSSATGNAAVGQMKPARAPQQQQLYTPTHLLPIVSHSILGLPVMSPANSAQSRLNGPSATAVFGGKAGSVQRPDPQQAPASWEPLPQVIPPPLVAVMAQLVPGHNHHSVHGQRPTEPDDLLAQESNAPLHPTHVYAASGPSNALSGATPQLTNANPAVSIQQAPPAPVTSSVSAYPGANAPPGIPLAVQDPGLQPSPSGPSTEWMQSLASTVDTGRNAGIYQTAVLDPHYAASVVPNVQSEANHLAAPVYFDPLSGVVTHTQQQDSRENVPQPQHVLDADTAYVQLPASALHVPASEPEQRDPVSRGSPSRGLGRHYSGLNAVSALLAVIHDLHANSPPSAPFLDSQSSMTVQPGSAASAAVLLPADLSPPNHFISMQQEAGPRSQHVLMLHPPVWQR